MLQRVNDLKQAAEDQTEKKAEGMTKVKWKDGFGANGPIEVTEYEGVLGRYSPLRMPLPVSRPGSRKRLVPCIDLGLTTRA